MGQKRSKQLTECSVTAKALSYMRSKQEQMLYNKYSDFKNGIHAKPLKNIHL